MAKCEWNPRYNRPAMAAPQQGDCQNEATASVGSGMDNYHLCASCGSLPPFLRMKKRAIHSDGYSRP